LARPFFPLEAKMSRRLLREGNESESSANPVDIAFPNTTQIVEGGVIMADPGDHRISNRHRISSPHFVGGLLSLSLP
jgi:hypothetical protein